MVSNSHYFKGITLLITHYNRSKSLERLLNSFKSQGYKFEEIVVSDDGSQPEQISSLISLSEVFNFRLVTTPKNKGLGNNINKGQEAVTTPYTLYVQEDFVPKPLFFEKLKWAARELEEHQDFDMVRFYAYFKYPCLKPYKEGFSEMVFNSWEISASYRKFYMYSDHPHLRRTTFLKKFGKYAEGVKGDVTEYRMMMSVLKNGGRGLFYNDFKELFDQINSTDEPSTMKRNFWRENGSFVIKCMRHLYRHVRFNFDYYFSSYH